MPQREEIGDQFIERFLAELDRNGPDGFPTDTGMLEATPESQEVYEEAKRAWESLVEFRTRRARARDFYWGKQWREQITLESGETITEEEFIKREGRIPWRMNHIRPTVRNLKGQYRQNQSDRQALATRPEQDIEALAVTQHLRGGRRINKSKSLEADGFQEFLISGLTAFHLGWRWWSRYDRSDVFIKRVETPRFFYNKDLRDRRLFDLRLVGQIMDLSLEQIIAAFAPNDPVRARAIAETYQFRNERDHDQFRREGHDEADSLQFGTPSELGLGRVVEVWKKRAKFKVFAFDPETNQFGELQIPLAEIAMEQQARAEQGLRPLEVDEPRFEEYWYGYYLTPDGEVLWEGESPYWHQKHPFVFGFVELFDGETKGVVDDIIDQQRLYNRMIAQVDKMMSTAARGVLLIPEEMIPDGMTPEQFAEDYATINGIIVYKAKNLDRLPPGIKPEQVYSNSIPAGAFPWLGTMLENIERTSGVRGPIMGETAKSGVAASLFQQQVIQGTINNLDYFENFFELVQEVDLKHLKLILQFQDDPVALRTDDGRFVDFKPEQVRRLEYDVTIGTVADTATMRQLFEEDMKEFLGGGRLTFRQFLQESSHPRARSLLETIERTNPLLEQQDQLGGLAPDFQQALLQAAQAGDLDAQALLTQAQ